MVQDNAMKAWREKKGFLDLLKADKQITAHLTEDELESLFDYNYYLKYVDSIFERLGLTKAKVYPERSEGTQVKIEGLAPHAL